MRREPRNIPDEGIVFRVIMMRENNPVVSYPDMAKAIGVSRAWISYIGKRLGMVSARELLWHDCPVCGNEVHKGKLCCSNRCRLAMRRVWLRCEECDGWFQRCKSAYDAHVRKGYKHIFCSRKCQGKWLGKRYGRGRKIREV